jgi:hypothetical protein
MERLFMAPSIGFNREQRHAVTISTNALFERKLCGVAAKSCIFASSAGQLAVKSVRTIVDKCFSQCPILFALCACQTHHDQNHASLFACIHANAAGEQSKREKHHGYENARHDRPVCQP